MDSLSLVGPHWKGYESLKYLFVFPDSPHPNEAEPLGVPFPGKTYSGEGKLNWVGYLAHELCPSGSGNIDPLLVYDYAKGGVVISGVRTQVFEDFLDSAGKKPLWAPWSAEDSLFATWIGIKYCGQGKDPAQGVDDLFKIQEKLYETGARNFLLFDAPPTLRAPISQIKHRLRSRSDKARRDPYRTWNTILRSDARGFVDEHPDASVFIFSAWDLFSEIFDDPVSYGFEGEDVGKAGGGIWIDKIHPTEKMHKLVAERVKDFLSGVKKRDEDGAEDIEVVFD
ncbi:hypothetical protein ACEPAG_5768 [Sanghuangporus baumii]